MTIRDRLRAGMAAAAVVLVALPGAAASASRRSLDARALAAVSRAAREVERRDAKCQGRVPERATFTHAAPSERLLSMLGVLRRPATPADVFPDQFLLQTLPAHDIYVDYIRRARVAFGRSFYVIAAADADPRPIIPSRCFRAERRQLRRDLRGAPSGLRRRALRFQSQLFRLERRPSTSRPREGLYLFDLSPGGGGGGGGGGIAEVERGMSLDSEDLTRHSALVSAIVPDGVATVTMRFGVGGYRLDPHGHLHRRRYRTRVTVTAAIEGNVLAARVPRPGFDAFPHSIVWRAADGHVIKVVHPPK